MIETLSPILQNKTEQYQAIGVLHGVPYKDESLGWAIKIKGIPFRLFIKPKRYKAWLKQLADHPNTDLYLLVYPIVKLIPKSEQDIYFDAIAWNTKNEWGEPNQFVLRGIWELIPQIKVPVLSVYRNKGVKLEAEQRLKTNHLPVFMLREDCKPFKYNPRLSKKEQPTKVFIEGTFKFLPHRKVFGFINTLNLTKSIPPRLLKKK